MEVSGPIIFRHLDPPEYDIGLKVAPAAVNIMDSRAILKGGHRILCRDYSMAATIHLL